MSNPNVPFVLPAEPPSIPGSAWQAVPSKAMSSLILAIHHLEDWRKANQLDPFKLGILVDNIHQLVRMNQIIKALPLEHVAHPAETTKGTFEIMGVPLAIASEK